MAALLTSHSVCTPFYAQWRSARAEKAGARTSRLCVRASVSKEGSDGKGNRKNGNFYPPLVPIDPEHGAGTQPKGLQRMQPGSGMEIVLHAARGEGELPTSFEEPFEPVSKKSSPRRTQRLKFTCNKCGETTVRDVNPHAMKTGTVFVQCGGCLVHHILEDNLNIFDDMKGPQYVDGTSFYTRGEQNKTEPDWEYISRMRGFSVWDGLDLKLDDNAEN